MQSGGGNPMNAAQLARLQQQLAQYGRGNGQQQQMMNPNAMGGMGNQPSQQQQLQQAFMQQQQNQGQQGGMQVRRNSALGMNSNSAAALAMMQQQQQQVAAGGSQMANANMSSYWNALQNQNPGTMDASSASSAQLAALAGMNMNNTNSSQNSAAANMLLGNRSSQSQPQVQPQLPSMGGNQSMQGGMGQTTDANLLQQQIAQLQRQLQQQQQQQLGQSSNQGLGGMQGNAGMDRRNSASNFGGMQGNPQQQQLYQQMQMANGMGGGMGQDAMGVMGSNSNNKMGNEQFGPMNNSNNMMQGQNMRNSIAGNNVQGIMSGSRGGLSQEELLLQQQQQQQLLRASGMSQSMQNDSQKAQEMFMGQSNNNNQADLMGQRISSVVQQQQQQGMDGSQMGSQRGNMGGGGVGGGFNNNMGFDMDGSVHSQRSASHQSQNKGNNNNNSSPLDVSAGGQMPGDKNDDPNGATQKSFLDGSFAGGWQSNADLPDRRRIIFSILEVIRQMRPDTNKISQKLPHMAKSLEEHLYRSAQTKEEYLDPSTLKKRLQLIAHGLEIHRSTSSGSVNSHTSQNKNNPAGIVPSENQQLQQFLAMQQGNNNNNNNMNPNMLGMGVNNAMPGGMGLGSNNMGNNGMQGNNNMQMDMLQGFGGGGMGGGMDSSMNSMSQSQNASMLKGDGSNYQDRIAAQKKKVIRQQQQRLLLLRHASKCKEGPNCKTKFCAQMMTLWKHMKKCRDKNCKTSHCLSSRCVLNHYRICKSQGRTSTCEVCGPVMEQIKRQDQEGSMDSSDPLAAKPDPDLPNQALPQLQQQMSGFGPGNQQNNVQAMQQQAMQQLYQQQQQALQQNQAGMQGVQNPQQQPNPQMQQNSLQAMGGGMANQIMSNDGLSRSQSGGSQQQDPQQMQNLQSAQQKLQQQQNVLRQLQKQQNQLLEQQKQLQEQQALLKDPGTQQAQQLQQQHQLLQQLQRRCQQQQALIQQELMLQMKTLGQAGQDMQQLQQQMGQSMGNNSQGSQQMNNSQNSHHSQNSNQMSQSNNMSNQMQMQGMNQDQMQGMGDKNNDSMNQMQGPMQNSMQDQSANQDEQLLQMQQAMNSQQQSNNMQNELSQEQQDTGDAPTSPLDIQGSQDQDDGPVDDLDDGPKPTSQPLSDSSERSASSKPRISKVRPKPVAGRGKGARGRGGKGKRLRDIADDLGSAGATLSATDATSMDSRKRTIDQMGGADDNEHARKTQKGDDPTPDSEKSGDADNKDGEGDPSSSLTSSMPKGDVEQHLLLLHKGLHLTSRTITHKCLPIVQQLIDDPFGWVFRDAVDPVVFGLPDYFEVVKNPMHLLLVKKKLENAVYTDMASFERDVKLVFENAILYNGDESEVGQLAQTMMGVFEREYKKVCEVTRNELEPIGPNACKLCGLERRRQQPPVLWCVGMSCGGQKIKRNAIYYTKGSPQNNWCGKCYAKLRDNESIILDDGSETRKSRLHEVKNNSNPEETWVRCDGCKANVHQVCALTNDRIRNPEDNFFCPKCDLKNRKGFDLKPSKYDRRAEDLQKCEMSDFMEEGLLKSLKEAYESKAREMDMPVEEVEKAEGIFIRVLSHITKKHTVRDEMYNLYSKAGCPSDYPAHTKCVGLFQKVDGVDVLLFAMYVYEYGEECPAPNKRRVYISYLDSVQYFEPPMFRTVAYQSIITEYLRFVKKRGFHTAHIWSCPPTPGDEYVFYCHPQSQKIPQEEQLRNWYINTLEKAKEEGVVVETTNFYEEYFANSGENAPGATAASPMSLPYFEGDYIPGEIEGILSSLTKEEKRNLPIGSNASRRSGSKLGTRSNPGSLLSQTQDKIMLRLGSAIFNMKENLMIARLRSKNYVAAVERGDDVSGWPDDEESLPVIKGKDSSILGNVKKENKDDDTRDNSSFTGQESGQLEMALVLSRAFANSNGPMVGNTIDNDPKFETELFENRQLFLNYCQMNHCQFDDLRKAKHSTMMVLYQLHNPASPKFLQQCGACYRDIAHGNRFHCNICANYDLCDECYKPVTSGAWSSRGKRYNHDTSHSFSRISLKETAEAKKTQEERTKSLQGYLEVLAHAANCPGAPLCKLNNCEKMKKLFVHVQTCDLTYVKGCKVCQRLVSLIIIHARSCDVRGSCSLPFCDKIRERNERLRRQQQLMDDRRRQAQNNYYGAGDA